MIPFDKIVSFAHGSAAGCHAVIQGDQALSWSDYHALVLRYLRHFAGRRYRRVAFLSPNRHELVALFSTFSSLGVPFVGIDYTRNCAFVRSCLEEIEADCLVYAGNMASLAQGAAGRDVQLWSIDADLATLRDSGSQIPLDSIERRPFESIALTSGTTGMPKAVRRTHPFDTKRFADLTAMFGFAADRFIAALPFYHVSTSGWARLFLSLGGSVVISDIESPHALGRDIAVHGVTALLCSPRTLEALVEEFERLGRPTALRFVMSGGGHLPRAVRRRAIEVLGPIVHEYYGTTETGLNAVGMAMDPLSDDASCFRPMNGNEVRILDENGASMRDGAVGRIAIQSYQNMEGYLRDRPVERWRIDGSDYLITADSGWVNHGHLFLANRSGDRSSTVDCYSLENELRCCPGVRDVVSAPVGSRATVLYVVVDSPVATTEVETRIRWLEGTHTSLKIEVHFVKSIPYSLSGKVRLAELPGLAAPVLTPGTIPAVQLNKKLAS